MKGNGNPSIALLNFPVDVVQKALSSFLDISDIVRLDSSGLVHRFRDSFQQLYRGITVTRRWILNIDISTARWLSTRAVYVQKMDIPQVVIDDWSEQFDTIMREVTDIRIASGSSRNNDTISGIFGYCRQLRSASVKGKTLDAAVLQAMMSSCPLLQHVDVSLSNVDSSIIVPLLSPRIVSLDLSFCRQINDSTIIAITSACTNLQSLKLDGRNSCTQVSLDAIGTACWQLQVLHLDHWAEVLGDRTVTLAAGCSSLRTLHIGCDAKLSSAAVRGFATHCKLLVDILLPYSHDLQADAIVELVTSCPQLRTADIPADNTVLVALAQHCPHLTELYMHYAWLNGDITLWNAGFAGENIAALLHNCQDLRKLTISGDIRPFSPSASPSVNVPSSLETLHFLFSSHEFDVTDEVVINLLQYVTNLRELHLFGGSECLTDAVVLAVAAQCPLLENVDLGDVKRLTDVSIIALAQHCSLVCRINLSGCPLLTDAAVIAIAQHCPQLTRLNLRNHAAMQLSLTAFPTHITGGIVDWNAALLALRAATDKAVCSHPITSISDASIAALAAHSHRLRELNVHGHALISETALTVLTAALPRCTVRTQ